MTNRTLTLVVFALNEIEGLRVVGPRINKHKQYLERILMIDGGSNDGSVEYAKELGWDVLIQPQNKKGMLNANNMAIEDCTTTHMIFFSPDNNCIPEKIFEIHKKLQEDDYDLIKVSLPMLTFFLITTFGSIITPSEILTLFSMYTVSG